MMKAILKFINTTILGGILFLAPIVLLVFILGKALAIAHKLLDPVVLRIPFKSIIGLPTPVLLAILFLVLFCFSAGLLARLAFAKKMV
ncbi:hypothetical protein JXA02_12570, partial [candidate division KSB1 bacterium]|nr:hypothetical protein [candidate division KSB1 bacterium]